VWFAGTALLHSLVIQERCGRLAVWNFVLVILSCLAAILGLAVVLPATLQALLWFLFLSGVYLVVDRRDYLTAEAGNESFTMNEASLFVSSVILSTAGLTVLWGKCFPTLASWITQQRVTISSVWYQAFLIPIGLLLLFSMAVTLALRQSLSGRPSWLLILASALSITVCAVLWSVGIRQPYVLMTYVPATFSVIALGREFIPAPPLRHYGESLAHLGVVLLLIGFSGQYFQKAAEAQLNVTDSVFFGNYEVRADLRDSRQQIVSLFKQNMFLETLYPKTRFFLPGNQSSPQIAIRSSLKEDLFIVLYQQAGGPSVVNVYVNPLVAGVWIGGFTFIVGTLLFALERNNNFRVAGRRVRLPALPPRPAFDPSSFSTIVNQYPYSTIQRSQSRRSPLLGLNDVPRVDQSPNI
jgi:cytochrome c-type biogenesis protein CcmF